MKNSIESAMMSDKLKDNKPADGGNIKKAFLENLKTVFLAILIALVIRSFFFEPFRIPSGIGYRVFIYFTNYTRFIILIITETG